MVQLSLNDTYLEAEIGLGPGLCVLHTHIASHNRGGRKIGQKKERPTKLGVCFTSISNYVK